MSYADMFSLAACSAVEAMGGPHVPWQAGRRDAPLEVSGNVGLACGYGALDSCAGGCA
jgi:catalase (peroxidase I)